MNLEDALVLIAELRAQNALLSAQVAEEQRQNAQLVERVTELEQKIVELEARKTSPPPWAKANRVQPEGSRKTTRRQRAPEHDHGRRQSTPTQIVQHAYERCPDCAYALAGSSVARRREVIEIPRTSVEVIEHRILKRYCPVCGAWKTPPASFEGSVLGQGRLGMRLARMRQDSERTQALARIGPSCPGVDRCYAACSSTHTSPQL